MKFSVLASTLLIALASAQAAAADGTITFEGEITTTTCSVNGGNGTNAGTSDFTVTLPTVSTAVFASADRAGNTPFSIIIGGAGQTGCADGKTASMHWENTGAAVDANGHLRNTAAGSNVSIALKNADTGSEINLNNPADTNLPSDTIAGNTAELKFTAEYVKPAVALTGGVVSSQLIYSVNYN